MDGIKFSIHPLFFAFGFYYALTNRILLFIIYTLSAVIHELGHSFVASKLGYKLKKISLMPFGAVVTGNIDDAKPIDTLKIAFSGPLINIMIAIIIIAVWWIIPDVYAFTDIVVEANLSIGAINLLPIFPLDGGRIVLAYLTNKYDKNKALKICRIIGYVFSICILALFVFSIFTTINISLLFFSLFIFFGSFEKNKDSIYIKIFANFDSDRLSRGIYVKRLAVDENITIKKLISLLDGDYLNELAVYSNGKCIKIFSPENVARLVTKASLYGKLREYVLIYS